MSRVPATEFKAKCLELMDRVARRRETFVITKRGKPVARLVPLARKQKDSVFGWLRGKAWITGDIVSPTMPEAETEILKEWAELNAPEPVRRTARKKAGRRAR